MATKAETEQIVDVRALNVYGKLIEARKRFLDAGIKKEGKNLYAEFKYFRLDEIIPAKQRIFREVGLADVISFGENAAALTVFNVDNPTESIVFMSQLAEDESMIKNPIQKVGAIQTYVRRYLYLLALDIIESDGIEETAGKSDPEGEETPNVVPMKSKKPKTEKERSEIKEELIDQGGEATETQIKAIKNGLKKLRAKDADEYEDYIRECLKKIKAGLTKKEAEDLLVEVGKKIEA